MDERTLDRLIRAGLVALVIGIVLVGIVYYLDRHPNSGPSLMERRTASAEAAVRKQPNNVTFRLQLAGLYREAKQPDNALEQYKEVLKVEPGQRAALLGTGELLAAKGKLAEATTSFKKIIGQNAGGEFAAVDPQLEAAYYGLGSILLKQGQSRDAMLALKQAIRTDAADADAWYLLGVAALKAGAPRSAVKALRRAVLFVPTGWCEPYGQLSTAYRALGRRQNAEYASAMVDFCEKRPGDAARRLKSLTSGPAAVDAMLGLGIIAEAQSDRAGAIRWYRKVLAADAGNTTAQEDLSRLGVGKASGSPSSPSLPPGHSSTEGNG